MTLRDAAYLQSPMFGRDLRAVYGSRDGRHENLDIDVASESAAFIGQGGVRRDLDAITGVDNAVQGIIHRIKTIKGELADLGHPDYGSRHHELIGQPNTAHNRNLVKLYILQALSREPRIEEVLLAKLHFDPLRDRDKVNLELTVQLIGAPVPANFVIPFSFASAT
jgi:phage baseplate assembly protein W